LPAWRSSTHRCAWRWRRNCRRSLSRPPRSSDPSADRRASVTEAVLFDALGTPGGSATVGQASRPAARPARHRCTPSDARGDVVYRAHHREGRCLLRDSSADAGCPRSSRQSALPEEALVEALLTRSASRPRTPHPALEGGRGPARRGGVQRDLSGLARRISAWAGSRTWSSRRRRPAPPSRTRPSSSSHCRRRAARRRTALPVGDSPETDSRGA
jgi:hypothetical protein